MKKATGTFSLLFFLVINTHAQPGTDIYMFDLKNENNTFEIKNKIRVTDKIGYDNQPFFHASNPLLYYSSANKEGFTDIMVYDYQSGETTHFTNTPDEKEYSPTLTPDGQFISTIIERRNGAQDFGKYPLGGGKPIVLFNKDKVGYHAWAGEHTAYMFILGEPNTLHVMNFSSGTDDAVAKNIGRAIHKVPGRKAISFIHKVDENEWWIKSINTQSKIIASLTPTLPGREDITWTPDGSILISDGSKLFRFTPGKSTDWAQVADLSAHGLNNVSRLAVNSKGDKLAVVVDEN
ncbi:hypothetical protein QQ008_04040 [Fulvivirgaceae bacterium BMA10]|uniref:Uncharacterized protein n=1 Tax=Splendidivirga corallicola TaxID=3051826 RepID=A0ABT8KIG3_9BACT|nr:hypothetical protein [Fulvivirgaceae bacterium BMA10]